MLPHGGSQPPHLLPLLDPASSPSPTVMGVDSMPAWLISSPHLHPKSKPKAANWRNIPFLNYNKMVILYGTDRASREGSHTIGDMRKRCHSIDEEDFIEDVNNNNVPSQHNVNIDCMQTCEDVNVNNVASGSSRKKQKVNSTKEKDCKLIEIKEVMSEMAQAIREGNQAIRESSRKLPQLSGEEVWNMIQDCDITPTHVTKIYRVLMGDVDQLRTFVECPIVARKNLLMDVISDLGIM